MKANYKKFLAVAAVAALALFAVAVFAHGGDPASKSITVKGEILDLACYLDHGARGAKHQQCALTCLKNGEPMGLITAEGKVYLLKPSIFLVTEMTVSCTTSWASASDRPERLATL